MPKKPYVVLEDSPNLVIVPNVTCCEPSPKKPKLDGDGSSQKLPTSTKSNNSAFAKKTVSKLNFGAPVTNNPTLIDTRNKKKSPTSWASNFLHSIGGSSSKFPRLLSPATKMSSLRKENTQPENNEEIIIPNSTKNTHQLKPNTSPIHPIMDKKNSVLKNPPININLIRPPNIQKPALQPTTPKEFSQPNCISKSNESKRDTTTNQIQVNKLPSLPKNYKIPIHSRCNKLAAQPVTDKEVTETSNVTKSYQTNCDITKLQSVTSLPKTNHATIQPRLNTLVLPGKIMNKEVIYTHPKPDLSNIHTSQHKAPLRRQKTTKELNYDKEVDLFLSKVTKAKEFKSKSKTEKNTNKPKCGINIIQQPKINKAQPKKDKETRDVRHSEEIKKHKTIKEYDLPKSYRNPLTEKYNEEVTSRKTDEEVAHSKINNKNETTYSTKLKTKKISIQSKSKHREVTRPKHREVTRQKHSEVTRLKKNDGQSRTNKEISNIHEKTNKSINTTTPPQSPPIKLKKKATENNASAAFTDSEIKQHIEIETNITKKEITKSLNDERSSKSISPIKSVVKKIKSDLNIHSPENRYHKKLNHDTHLETSSYKEFDYHKHNTENNEDPNVDLRSKLKRKITKKYINKEDNNCGGHRSTKDKFATVPNTEPFVPKENLIISFEAKDDIEEKVMTKTLPSSEEKVMAKTSPVKKLARKQPPGRKKCKKIKLEINIVFDHADTTDEESVKTEDEANDRTLENTDFSFLDDFNVDDIVQCLNECESSSMSTNNEANLAVNDGIVEGAIHSNRKTADAEAMVKCENSELMTQIDNNTNTLLDNDHQAMELEATANEDRSLNQDDIFESKFNIDAVQNNDTAAYIQKLPALDSSIIKKEIHMNQNVEIEKINEQREKSEDSKVCSGSSELAMVKSEIVTLSNHKNVMLMDISQHNVANEMDVMDSDLSILDDRYSNRSSYNNTEEDTKKFVGGHSGTIIENDCIKANNIVGFNSTDQIEILEPEISYIGAERDVIIIDDSDTENERETKKTQSVPQKNEEMKKAATIPSDEVLIDPNITAAINSESVLILDTDYIIGENSNYTTKCQLTGTDKNANRENLSPTECEVNTKEMENSGDLYKQDQTAGNNSVDLKTKSFTESNSESEKSSTDSSIGKSDDIKTKCKNTSSESKTDTNNKTKSVVKIQQNKDENEVSSEVAEKNDSETSDENQDAKTKETVASKKITPNKVIVNEQNKKNPQANCDNDDKVETKSEAKPKAAASSSVYNYKFVKKLGCKLLDITGQRYTIKELIHVGKFSKIYKCTDPRKWDFAVKVMHFASNGVYQGLQKQNMMMKLQNGVPEQNLNCVRFLEGFPVFVHWCFLMEYYPRNLTQALAENRGSFHIDLVQVLSRQLVSAVTILRNNNIIHSDIKPSHVLINASKTRLKLCGFDQSFYFDGGKLLPNTGTCNYRAPELILGYPAGYGIDVWSTALVMYEMATNKKLFPGIYNNDILYKQLCTVGNGVPMEMLMGSTYRSAHFINTSFARIVNSAGQRIIIDEIKGNDKINNTLFRTYATKWAKQRNRTVREDKAKLCAFSKLLHSMLAIHPRQRIAIEFVFANPFVYETFDLDLG